MSLIMYISRKRNKCIHMNNWFRAKSDGMSPTDDTPFRRSTVYSGIKHAELQLQKAFGLTPKSMNSPNKEIKSSAGHVLRRSTHSHRLAGVQEAQSPAAIFHPVLRSATTRSQVSSTQALEQERTFRSIGNFLSQRTSIEFVPFVSTRRVTIALSTRV